MQLTSMIACSRKSRLFYPMSRMKIVYREEKWLDEIRKIICIFRGSPSDELIFIFKSSAVLRVTLFHNRLDKKRLRSGRPLGDSVYW
jgi:hypothetical protein